MSKYLVVIESPKAKKTKIQSFLGSDYEVVATVGHIRDLPPKGLNVDLKKQFSPTYGIMLGKESIVKDIVAKAKKAEKVYLMTDPDREGEAISWHVKSQLPQGVLAKRAKFHSVTKPEILEAIKNAGEINEELVESYEARRILDRLVGYKCSFITKQATGGQSAGRVQSAALRVIAEREKEIKAFVPQEYWPVEAELLTLKDEKINADVKKPAPLDISTQAKAEEIMALIKKGPVLVSKYEQKEAKVHPYAPFTTSTMLQSAASFLGWTTKRTMDTAQALYERGSITYHRTDSKFIVAGVVNDIRNEISSSFGQKYVPQKPNFYSNSANAQEAHEACRVYDVKAQSIPQASADEQKLYQMIWKRTVASQMEEAVYERRSAEFAVGDVVMSATGSRETFDGFRKVWTYGGGDDKHLPELTVGDKVKVIDVKTERKETQPPDRYSEASIVKKLESEGIGRPSTYASIIETLKKRKYVDGKGKSFVATDLGINVSDFLVDNHFCFIDLGFTAAMEDKLDQIASKKTDKVSVLTEFWDRLKKDIDTAQKASKEAAITDHDCPTCKGAGRDGKLAIKHSKFGAFYACSLGKATCGYTAKIGENGEPIEKVKKVVQTTDKPCPKCGSMLVVRNGKYGDFLGCPKWPKCEGIYDMDGNLKQKKTGGKKFWKKKEE